VALKRQATHPLGGHRVSWGFQRSGAAAIEETTCVLT
jgi:hypothetical protein